MNGYGWAVFFVILVALVLCGLILLGWYRRGRRQADFPRPVDVPELLSEPRTNVEGMYVVTTGVPAPLAMLARTPCSNRNWAAVVSTSALVRRSAVSATTHAAV
jgi:hypothetical protein